MMSGQILNKINFLLGGIILFSLLLFPNFIISTSLPAFQLIDFLFPFVLILIIIQRKLLSWQLIYKVLLVFCSYILLTILVNGRFKEIRDYFELYKLLKFAIVILLFTLIDYKQFFKFWIKPTFIFLVVGNLIHYFDMLGLNPILEKHYDGGIHIQWFGLNSIGQPDMKRMVGFSGNPNINSLVFGFFSVLFLPKKEYSKHQFGWFFVATFMFFLCQSRTNFIALFVILIFLFFWKQNQFKFSLAILSTVFISFVLSFLISTNSYINLLFDKKIVQNSSLLGRFDTWEFLWEMIKEKPIFGHAPFKEFFYDRNLHAENEFILQTWRYGFIGLILFIIMVFSPMYSGVKNKFLDNSLELILFSLFIMINSLTNTPFTNPTVNVLFAILIGFYFGALKVKPSI